MEGTLELPARAGAGLVPVSGLPRPGSQGLSPLTPALVAVGCYGLFLPPLHAAEWRVEGSEVG